MRLVVVAVSACLVALVLSACGGQPSSYTPVGEMSGPGLLSGKEGEFVLYRR